MRAVAAQHGALSVVELPDPEPGPGQLLVEVARCGICGSDLHSLRHGDELAEVLDHCGYPRYARSDQQVVPGHELTGTVLARGPRTRAPGTRGALEDGQAVVALPLVRRRGQVDAVGLSSFARGAYAERVVVQEAFTLPVPDGMPPDAAALVEPTAVAWHAVARSRVAKGDVAVVIGCGPVGLAVVAVLKARGVRTVIASDLSAGRRDLASRCGADVVVDPSVTSPFEGSKGYGHVTAMADESGAGIDAVESLRKLPVPWSRSWRALKALGKTSAAAPVVFECVGVPGMIDSVLEAAPLHTRLVVVGVCMGADSFRPSLAVNKEIDLVCTVGYDPLEFHDTMAAMARGTVDVSAMLTGHVGLDGVARAFADLADPEKHAKILIDPSLGGDQVVC